MSTLAGARVALLEARLSGEMGELVERLGGVPYRVPAVRESSRTCGPEVAALIDRLSRHACHAVIFLTGVGVERLFDEAEHLGRLSELLTGLGHVLTVCRGPKPAAPLRQRGIPIGLTTPSPFTTADLLAAMAHLELAGKCVAVVHYGERNEALADALVARGAEVHELQMYEWLMPEDLEPLRTLVDELAGGRVDAIAFTSQIQVRHLWTIAETLGRVSELADALNHRVVTASIGPTCTAVLRGLGVEPKVVADPPKMRPLITALAQYLESAPPPTEKNQS